jgi:hypothetical protein
VAKVYQALPAEDRHAAAILAYNYGEAGAIDYLRSALRSAPSHVRSKSVRFLGGRTNDRQQSWWR